MALFHLSGKEDEGIEFPLKEVVSKRALCMIFDEDIGQDVYISTIKSPTVTLELEESYFQPIQAGKYQVTFAKKEEKAVKHVAFRNTLFDDSPEDFDRDKFYRIQPAINRNCGMLSPICRQCFTVPKRYGNLRLLENRKKDIVLADNLLTGEKVVIKKKIVDEGPSSKKAYREFKLLNGLRHPNIIRLLDAFTPQASIENFREMYFVTELMNRRLSRLLCIQRPGHEALSYFLYQILCAIRYLHYSGIIHTDLNPESFAVDEHFVLKLVDLKRARIRGEVAVLQTCQGGNVSSRHYCAPEITLNMLYTEKVDIWSVGCIFAEMIIGYNLFSGKDRVNKLKQIIKVTGLPADDFLIQLPLLEANFIRSLPWKEPQLMEKLIPNYNFQTGAISHAHQANDARDLLSKMLKINPGERISAAEALQHPYVIEWYQEEEVNARPSGNRLDPRIQTMERSLSQWRELVFNEVKNYENTRNIISHK